MYDVQNTGDWRGVVRKNKRRTRWVIFFFILLFLMLGLAIDYLWTYSWASYKFNVMLTFQDITYLYFYGKLIPYATIITTVVAFIWVACTFLFYDKIMLSGTKAYEITASTTDPLGRQIYNLVEEMKIAANMNFMPKVYIIDASYLNAFASGYSEKSAMIALTRALVETLNRDELQAVIAHELTHIRNEDIKLNLFVAALSNMLIFMLESAYIISASTAMRRTSSGSRQTNNGAVLVFMIIAILRLILPLITMVLRLFLSRSREYMADAGAVQLMRNNEPLARALIKINQSYQHNELKKVSEKQPNESMRRASYIYNPARASFTGNETSDFFSTHPSLSKRLKAIGIKLNKN
ncbi:zinc metalloprotease HtpX [Thiotrichales bacterium 19S11-10]|nr:zinc metalloprotease HtpX [Thiotrichales bacterium 19S11-10]